MKQIQIQKLLGDGGYGKVYSCINEDGEEFAVKCVTMNNKTGIPCLIEPIIMLAIQHPFINHAIKAYSNQDKLYILQDLAETDLRKYNIEDERELVRCLYSITLALYVLHQNRIIHADIKASNILRMKDGHYKLTDFTLSSVFHWTHNHIISTSTHRAPEVWLNRNWDHMVDIWSLGCTFYEIAYQRHLFPYQGKLGEGGGKMSFNQLKDANINCILDWVKFNPYENPETINIKARKQKYRKLNLSLGSSDNSGCNNGDFNIEHPLNQLIFKMLRFNASDRITLVDIINDPYFDAERGHFSSMMNPVIIEIPEPELSAEKDEFFNKCADYYCRDDIIQDYAKCLYRKISNLKSIDEHHKVEVCFWIAFKLIIGFIPSKFPNKSKVLINEKIICEHLNFRLYSSRHNTYDNFL